MSSHGYLGEPNRAPSPRFYWKCPQCEYHLTAVTEGGRRSLSEHHMEGHIREFREEMIRLQAAPPREPAYYQRLRLNWADIGFLKVRGIAIDSDIFYDKEMPYKSIEGKEINQDKWARILERVCNSTDRKEGQ